MKKKILAVMLVSAVVLAVNAQDDYKKFRFGLKGAPAISWLKPDVKGVENDGLGFGFNYGLMMDFALGSPNYAISTGFEVSNLGGKLKFPDMQDLDSVYHYGMNTRQYKLTYINLPIQLKLKTKEIGYMTYFGHFGFELGVNVKARANDEINLVNKLDLADTSMTLEASDVGLKLNEDIDLLHRDPQDDEKNEVQPLRMALVVGAGFEYNISGNTSLVVGISYNNGFLPITKGNSFEKSETYEGPALIKDDTDPKYNQPKQEIDAFNNPITSPKMKATSQYVALNVGIFF